MTVLEEMCQSGQLLDQLMRLQTRKRELIPELDASLEQNYVLRQQVVIKKANIISVEEEVKAVKQRVDDCKDQSLAAKKRIETLEVQNNFNINHLQDVRLMMTNRRSEQMKRLDEKAKQVFGLCKKFTTLFAHQTQTGKQMNVVSNISDTVEVDQEIENYEKKLSILNDELAKSKANPLDVNKLDDYEWKDWPISHRMIATKQFINEFKLFEEELDCIEEYQRLEGSQAVSDATSDPSKPGEPGPQ